MCPHYLLERLQGLYSRLEKSHRSAEELPRGAGAGPAAAHPDRENGLPGSIGRRRRPRAQQPHRDDHDVQPDPAEGAEPDHESWQNDITLVVQEADRAAKIVKDLLSFAKETKVKPGLVNINGVIKEALSLLVKQSLFHNIDVRYESGPDAPDDVRRSRPAQTGLLQHHPERRPGHGRERDPDRREPKGRGRAERSRSASRTRARASPKNISPGSSTRSSRPRRKGPGWAWPWSTASSPSTRARSPWKAELGQGATFIILLPVLGQKEWLKSEDPSEELTNASRRKRP